MAGRQVAADRTFQSDTTFRGRLPHIVALAAGVRKDFPDKILLGAKVGVKRAISQPSLGHDSGDTNRRDALLSKLPGRNVDNASASGVFVSLVVPHFTPTSSCIPITSARSTQVSRWHLTREVIDDQFPVEL